MSITVEELIKKCKSNPKYDLSKHLKTKYIPYIEKISTCETIIELTSHKDDGKRRLVSINTPARYILFITKLISLYTDIEIRFDKAENVKQYDALAEADLIDQIVGIIPSEEFETFNLVLNMVLDDFRDNEYSITALLYNFKESLHISEELIEEIVNKLDAEK